MLGFVRSFSYTSLAGFSEEFYCLRNCIEVLVVRFSLDTYSTTRLKPFVSYVDPRYFLLERPQRVCVNGCLSDYVCMSTGSPHGLCVISTAVHFVYKQLQTPWSWEQLFLIKCSDDTAAVSLLFGDHNDHGAVVSDFVNWCDDSYLCLNVSKIKIFSSILGGKALTQPDPIVIHSDTVESVDHYKYLGTTGWPPKKCHP